MLQNIPKVGRKQGKEESEHIMGGVIGGDETQLLGL